MTTLCAVDGCGKQLFARGWCTHHYQRWYRFGDPLRNRPAEKSENDSPSAALVAQPELAQEEESDAPSTALATRAEPMHLVALTPHEITGAQTHLVSWCEQRINTIRAELRDIRQNIKIARTRKWASVPWERQQKRAERSLDFYAKVLAALHLGYLLIPNLPIDVFAIRTARKTPTANASDSQYTNRSQSSQSLPVGEGRYVSPDPRVISTTITASDEAKKEIQITTYFADAYQDWQFPVVAVKPTVLDATAQAMALNLFDEIGMVTQFHHDRDPIIIGRIKHPRWVTYNRVYVSFFIAWWLDTQSL